MKTQKPRDAERALERAVEELRDAVAMVWRSSSGDVKARRLRRLRLAIDLDLEAEPATQALGLLEQIDSAVEAFRSEISVFRSGQVPCLRHSTEGDCSCVKSPAAREVLVGWGPTGVPRFADFAQQLLDSGHRDLDRLYSGRAGVVVRHHEPEDLLGEVLDAYRPDASLRVHGQISAGWYKGGGSNRCAVSFLLLSTKGKGRPLRAQLVQLGTTEEGEDLDAAFGGSPPWREAVVWARRAIADVERAGGAAAPKRFQGILQGLGRRLERRERATRRKTRHAETRRRQRRPTGMALPDLKAAPDERVLHDPRRDTWIVLGDRGRVHVFNREAKLVTSIRYSPASIDKRVAKGHWKPVSSESAHQLRSRAPQAQDGAPESSG